jgi:tartrate dehydratase beta subunit/fumarate hydratase class I family protein
VTGLVAAVKICAEKKQHLGMEAVWKIEVEDFPAFILVDDKGNDFFKHPPANCEQCAVNGAK